MSSLDARLRNATRMPGFFQVARSIGVSRSDMWAGLLRTHSAGARRILVCGEGEVVDHWIASAPEGVTVDHVGTDRLVATLDLLLGLDRFGEIGAVLIACDGDADTTAETLRDVRAVIDRSFHDATLLADWTGSEDEADFPAADVVVAEASEWLAGPSGAVMRGRTRAA